MTNPKTITIATEPTTDREAIYVDGRLLFHEHTIHASDIVSAACGELVELQQVVAEPFDGDWPDDLMELVGVDVFELKEIAE